MDSQNKIDISSAKGKLSVGKRKDLLFYILVIGFPVLQFCVFYIGVNFNSLLLAFKDIDIVAGMTAWTFSNFSEAFHQLTTSPTMFSLLKMSGIFYVLLLVISTPLGLLFSYYIYKKMAFYNGFRVFLYLPSIISGIVMVTIFQFFVERAIPAYMNELFGVKMKGLMENMSTRYATIIFYNIWVGFGTTVLMYANGMSGISQDMVEAAKLDGVNSLQEFWYITLPMIYPTFTTFIVTGIAGLFTNSINLYSFYGSGAPENLQTFGYWMYVKTLFATSKAEYPLLSAYGMLFTVVVVPLTLFVKWAMEKFGPSED